MDYWPICYNQQYFRRQSNLWCSAPHTLMLPEPRDIQWLLVFSIGIQWLFGNSVQFAQIKLQLLIKMFII